MAQHLMRLAVNEGALRYFLLVLCLTIRISEWNGL